MADRALNELTLAELARGIAGRTLSSRNIVQACLDRIAARESTVKAWAHLDPDAALEQARHLDEEHPRSPLHGIPVGLKDIIDTADMPTTYGCAAFANHQVDQDAACVSRLRNAGAVILGKTVTTEFAYYAPGPTTNPHNAAHTPGGSSSGSAAAVADFHIPLALGSQTAGSIIRPASYTGVIGYKPTYATYPLDGVQAVAPSLDTLGVFTRAIDDLALANNVLASSEAMRLDATTATRPRSVAVVRGPQWDLAEPDMRRAFDAFVTRVEAGGIVCRSIEPDALSSIFETQTELLAYESVATLGPIVTQFHAQIRAQTRQLIEQGRQIDDGIHARVTTARSLAADMLAEIFSAHDVVVTPSAPGEAPAGLDATGDPMFNRVWTFCHAPCINLPAAWGDNKLPLGVQFVGTVGGDRQLLDHAHYLRRYRDDEMTLP